MTDFSQHLINTRLATALPGWAEHQVATPNTALIGILRGEGIGPEILSATVEVLQAIERASSYRFEIRYGGLIGNHAKKVSGRALTPEIIEWVDALFQEKGTFLCGPAGQRFVYDLRARFNLFCKLTPIFPCSALSDAGVLRPQSREKVDIIVVRENVSGMYFGEASRTVSKQGQEKVRHTFTYDTEEVNRIIRVGITLAQNRRGRLALVVKPDGIPEISKLWTDIFWQEVQGLHLETRVLEIDNASYQIVASAQDFDVIVAPNLFGDILADNAALLLGSRGLSYSGNFGANNQAAYQTGHGAAHNIAGKDTANPIGQILSAAFMLRESFHMFDAAFAIEEAIEQTLALGIRTPDISSPGSTLVGTQEMGLHISRAVESLLTNNQR